MWDQIKKIFNNQEVLEITDEYQQIMAAFEEGQNLYITGKAGSGKSKLIEHLRNTTNKKIIVLAPTGLAALNVRGQTIHSFFKLPPRLLTREAAARVRTEAGVLRQLDAIVIDEASMVRADVLDAIDVILRKHGRDKNLAFGGTQVVLVGDLYQLPPVVNSQEMEIFKTLYQVPYFFGANVYQMAEFETRQLTKIFRQNDEEFIKILNRIRDGDVEQSHLEQLNKRTGKRGEMADAVLLAATNRVVNEINIAELAKLGGREKIYIAEFEGDFPNEDRTLPVEKDLRLKKGARVVILKNGAGWVNGSMGKVTKLEEFTVSVKLDDGPEVEIGIEEWANIKYEVDRKSGKINEAKTGVMRQFPLRLAWAVTIHKSQGMTFEQVYLDLSSSPFAHGQTYVALSRCKTLNGLAFSRPLYPSDIIVDLEIVNFSKRK